jgi:hypothetical protein
MHDSLNAKLANPANEVPVFTYSKQESKLAWFYSQIDFWVR